VRANDWGTGHLADFSGVMTPYLDASRLPHFSRHEGPRQSTEPRHFPCQRLACRRVAATTAIASPAFNAIKPTPSRGPSAKVSHGLRT
jgi:hypothetical protein